MLRRWVVKHGPEFAESERACDVPADRLKLHLDAIRLNLERDPLSYSEPFGNESRRVIETRDDFADGFVLTAYVVLRKDFTAELMWIETRRSPHGEEDDR